jgi:hypothetical protein
MRAMSAGAVPDGAMCVPNISAAGRRRRTRFAIVSLAIGVVALAVLVAVHASPWLRALVGLPIAAGVASQLQVMRNTCVAHARAGTIEHDDLSTTKAPADENAASRRVASGIVRDAAIAGAVAAALAWCTAYVV